MTLAVQVGSLFPPSLTHCPSSPPPFSEVRKCKLNTRFLFLLLSFGVWQIPLGRPGCWDGNHCPQRGFCQLPLLHACVNGTGVGVGVYVRMLLFGAWFGSFTCIQVRSLVPDIFVNNLCLLAWNVTQFFAGDIITAGRKAKWM